MMANGRPKLGWGDLTKGQERVLEYIKTYIAAWGMPPTMAEMTDGLGFRSANAVVEHMKRLERQGWIRTERRRARAMWVLPTPDPHRPKGGVDNAR